MIQKIGHLRNCRVAVAPPLLYLDRLASLLGGGRIELVAQNVDVHLSGTYTGEISASVLRDVGVDHVMVGHSERRILHGESEDLVLQKLKIVQETGLCPILCIGDTSADRKNGLTNQVCSQQIGRAATKLETGIFEKMMIAYEPLWAVGAHGSASPQIVQEVHEHIRSCISRFSSELSRHVLIHYGGSVNSGNVEDLTVQPDVDGFLIGKNQFLKKENYLLFKD